MTERKNLLQNIIEKPKQAIINLATMVKTRIAECEEKERQRREIYLTTPPKPGKPLVRYEDNVNYATSGSQIATKWEYTWTPDQNRWILTKTDKIWISGTGMH